MSQVNCLEQQLRDMEGIMKLHLDPTRNTRPVIGDPNLAMSKAMNKTKGMDSDPYSRLCANDHLGFTTHYQHIRKCTLVLVGPCSAVPDDMDISTMEPDVGHVGGIQRGAKPKHVVRGPGRKIRKSAQHCRFGSIGILLGEVMARSGIGRVVLIDRDSKVGQPFANGVENGADPTQFSAVCAIS
jgi:hypothetical protein